jgi:hypothetical protein
MRTWTSIHVQTEDKTLMGSSILRLGVCMWWAARGKFSAHVHSRTGLLFPWDLGAAKVLVSSCASASGGPAPLSVPSIDRVS